MIVDNGTGEAGDDTTLHYMYHLLLTGLSFEGFPQKELVSELSEFVCVTFAFSDGCFPYTLAMISEEALANLVLKQSILQKKIIS